MKSSKFFAVAALSALAAFGSVAQARTLAGEVGMIEVPTQSTLERSVVRNQASDAVRQGLVPSGEASVVRAQAPAASSVDRATVRAQTVEAVRTGQISHGEVATL